MMEAFAVSLTHFIMKTTKHCVGVDVSKDSIVCCLGSSIQEGSLVFSRPKTFTNDLKGFGQLLDWCLQQVDNRVSFVLEATGVYYERLAFWLDDRNQKLSVVLPNKIKHYSKSLNIKTKTDNVDAQILSRFGLERKLDYWKMPTKFMREIKSLTREYQEAKVKLVAAKNQLHAKEHSYDCLVSVLRRLKRQISLLENQLLEIEAELRTTVMSDTLFYDKITKVITIPGVSFITAIIILAETNGFALVKNAKQLVSYCGLDIQHNQSGGHEGKSKISKKGNSFIRKALYMPALAASRYNKDLKVFYERIIDSKPAKKIGITAVARKLLILIYILWKNDQEYIFEEQINNPVMEVGRY